MTDDEGPTMKLNRKPERGVNDRAAFHEFLDSQLVATLATVSEGRPQVVPILYVRDGDRLLFHGSTGAGTLGIAAAGAPVVCSVFQVEGLRVSYNGFHSGANYRSAVIEGVCEALSGEERERALELLTERLIPGRAQEVLPASRKEVAATSVLALPVRDEHWLFKVRSGDVKADPEADGVWMGYVPLPVVAGDPVPAVGQDPKIPVPDSVWRTVRVHRPS